MGQAQHTQGEWLQDKGDEMRRSMGWHYSEDATILMGNDKWPLVITEKFEVACAVNPKYGSIIAAAPKLLEALEHLLNWSPESGISKQNRKARDQARLAVSDAKGKSPCCPTE